MVAIARAENVLFNPVQQCIEATLIDHNNHTARMMVPFHARGQIGFNHFLNELQTNGNNARFVSGHVSLANQQLTFRPLAIILEIGGSRRAIQPYWSPQQSANRPESTQAADVEEVHIAGDSETSSYSKSFFHAWHSLMLKPCCWDFNKIRPLLNALLRSLFELAKSLGLLRISHPIERLYEELNRSHDDPHFQIGRAVQLAQHLA